MIPVPDYILWDVDMQHWGKDFDPANPVHTASAEHINTYIAFCVTVYRTRELTDSHLWRTFHEDFWDWKIEIWKLANTKAIRQLRDELVIGGVWVNSQSGGRRYSNCLQICLGELVPAAFLEDMTNERKALVAQRKKEKTSAILASVPLREESETLHREHSLQLQLLLRLITELIKVYNNCDNIKYGGEDYKTL